MSPSDLTVLGLMVQALALGHGAITLMYIKDHPVWATIPLLLLIGYFVVVILYPPAALRHDGRPNPHPWPDVYQYLLQVAAFGAVIEGLLYSARRVAKGKR